VARPERAQERIRISCSLDRNHIRLLAIPNLPPFQGGSLLLCVDPGLKPRAESCCPFGTSPPPYSITQNRSIGRHRSAAPILHYPTAPSLQHSITPLLHYSFAAMLLCCVLSPRFSFRLSLALPHSTRATAFPAWQSPWQERYLAA
jgi:hypothetical protein